MATGTVIKRYKGEKAYQKDAEKMAKSGYQVVAVNDQGKPWLINGAMVKRRYLVTYSKAP